MSRSLFILFCLLSSVLLACSDGDATSNLDAGGGDGDSAGDGDGDSAGDGDGSGDGDGPGDGDTAGDGDMMDDRPAVNFAPMFPGSGTSDAGEPLQGGMVCDSVPGETTEAVEDLTRCFFGPMGGAPAATIEQVLECVDGVQTVHLRLTFDPGFADNTYGDGAVGWPDGHTFDELVGSDHAELLLIDGDGEVAMELKVDYISESENAPSGYASGCVEDGGKVETGDPMHVVACSTSLDENLNARGLDGYLESSPPTDENYTPSQDAPEWDYRIVYEVWIDVEAFGDSGFSGAFINQVHASPSKGDDNTIEVTPGECPPCMESSEYVCEPGDDTPGDGDGDGDTPSEDPGCLDDDPDTLCSDPPPPGEPAFCQLYPTDPACKPQ